MRRLLFAVLTFLCSNAFAAFEYSTAGAKISTNVDASFFDSIGVTEVAAASGHEGYSLITLSKVISPDDGKYFKGSLDVSITTWQAGAVATSANATLSIDPPTKGIWLSNPSASLFVNSPVSKGIFSTNDTRTISLVNESLPHEGVQAFNLTVDPFSGMGVAIYGCGGTPCSSPFFSPSGSLVLTFRVSNVPELSSAAMTLLGAMLMPFTLGLRRRQLFEATHG